METELIQPQEQEGTRHYILTSVSRRLLRNHLSATFSSENFVGQQIAVRMKLYSLGVLVAIVLCEQQGFACQR
jgi:hypothetical protein